MAHTKQSHSLHLPPGSVAYARALLSGRKTSFHHAHQPPIEVPAHSHTEGQISFLIEPAAGVVRWSDKRERWQERTLTGPQIYLVAPGQVHSNRWDREAEWLDIYCEPRVLQRMGMRKLRGVYFADAASAAGSDFVIWQLTSILRYLCHESRPNLELMENIALGLLSRLVKLLQGESSAPVGPVGPVLSRELVQRIHAYVLANLRYEIHVADLAKLAGLSVAHFTDVFKRTTGRNPYEFITERRMLKAHELLFAGGQTLGKVSRAVGFQDQGYFSRKFQVFFGYGPRFLRRHARPPANPPNKP